MPHPPDAQVGPFFRGKLKWEAKKDRILRSCMSSRWMEAKEKAGRIRKLQGEHLNRDEEDEEEEDNNRFNMAMTEDKKGRAMKEREHVRMKRMQKKTQTNPKSLIKQFSLQNLKGNRMQF